MTQSHDVIVVAQAAVSCASRRRLAFGSTARIRTRSTEAIAPLACSSAASRSRDTTPEGLLLRSLARGRLRTPAFSAATSAEGLLREFDLGKELSRRRGGEHDETLPVVQRVARRRPRLETDELFAGQG